jgi:hypothetical protein
MTISLPEGCELIHSFASNDSVRAEAEMHLKLSSFHVNGEWFLLSDAQISEIKTIDKMEFRNVQEPPQTLGKALLPGMVDLDRTA